MKNFIKNYAKSMTKNDLIVFINKKNYIVSNQEIDIIYKHIKKYYNEIIDDPPKYIKMLKEQISEKNYNEILNLFNQYKNYLK